LKGENVDVLGKTHATSRTKTKTTQKKLCPNQGNDQNDRNLLAIGYSETRTTNHNPFSMDCIPVSG